MITLFFTCAMIVSMETRANQWLRQCILLVPVSTETCILDCQKRSCCCPAKLAKWHSSGITSFLPIMCSAGQSQRVWEWQSSSRWMMLLSVQCANPRTCQGVLPAVGWDYQAEGTVHCNLENINGVKWLVIGAARNEC